MKPTAVIAFCPGHISGYFRRIGGETIATTGSIGAGVVISEGVTATVEPSRTTTVIIHQRGGTGSPSGTDPGSPLLTDVMEQLDVTTSITTECLLPIGAGFGLSAAALLATIVAVNRLYDLGMDPEEIAQCAHRAEVRHRTGLGDVAACQGGGRVIRHGPGIHGFIERRFDMSGPLYAVSFGPIHTPSVLDSPEQMERVSSAFPKTTPYDAMDFFHLSRCFAEQSGLITPEVREVTRLCDAAGVPSGMTMLGNGVFAYGRRARDMLLPFGPVYEFHVADAGVRIVEDVV
ncbi:MAG: pantoate kinase [Methanoregula sp.]|jgi:pantoate kinase